MLSVVAANRSAGLGEVERGGEGEGERVRVFEFERRAECDAR